jgi:hypothetical protein
VFDRATCCGLRQAGAPQVDSVALERLKSLISSTAVERAGAVIEARGHDPKEMPMRRPSRLSHTLQLDLFRPTRRERAPQDPDWRQLPAEARETATRLMARMHHERKTRAALDRPESLTTSEKIKPHHLDRKAILYVRQSSARR